MLYKTLNALSGRLFHFCKCLFLNIKMMKKRTFISIKGTFLFVISISLFYCNNNKEAISTNGVTKIYFNDNEIIEEDTINQKLNETIVIYFESPYDSILFFNEETEIHIEYIDHHTYRFIPQSTGIASIAAIAITDKNEMANNSFCSFHINVSSYTTRYIFQENDYNVELSGSIMIKEEIQNILKVNYSPYILSLKYSTTKKGEFSYVSTMNITTHKRDTITGTFSCESTKYQLHNGNISRDIKIEKYINTIYKLYIDLTEEFKAKYPEEEVSLVNIISITTATTQ